MSLENLLFFSTGLILLCIVLAKYAKNLGVPSLILFLGVGVLAGTHGPGEVQFNDPILAQNIGIISLVLILFSGGLDTEWHIVRRTLWPALSLATFGVLITGLVVGVFAYAILNLSLLECLLLGAVISSTDAAAVFSVLRSKGTQLKERLAALLELESGTNDPMAVFLTIALIELVLKPETPALGMIPNFIWEMSLGGIIGFVSGRAIIYLLNHLRSPFDGIYPVTALAAALFVFGLTTSLHGSGFLAVYIAAVYMGEHDFMHKKTIMRFFDGLAWLSQIGMFVTLGLLIQPQALLAVSGEGLILAGALMFLARPLATFICLPGFGFSLREKLLIAWGGLRGAVPIILATFPLLAGVPGAETIFNVVFFIVLLSTLLQGWTLVPFAEKLGLGIPREGIRSGPMDFTTSNPGQARLVDLKIPPESRSIGTRIVELGLPPQTLVVLITRSGQFVVPTGETTLMPGDITQVLTSKESLEQVSDILTGPKSLKKPD